MVVFQHLKGASASVYICVIRKGNSPKLWLPQLVQHTLSGKEKNRKNKTEKQSWSTLNQDESLIRIRNEWVTHLHVFCPEESKVGAQRPLNTIKCFIPHGRGHSHTAKLRVKEASKPHSHVYWYSSGPLFCHLIAHQKLYTSPVNQDSLTTWILLDPQTKPFPISSSSSSLKLGHLKFQMIDFPYAPS